jgi:ABC-type multidrug transport system fused ATPase/permease subunit
MTSALDRLGLDDEDPLRVAFILALTAAILMLCKSALSFLLTRRVLFFLANRQVAISSRLASAFLSRPLIMVQSRASQDTAYALTTGVNAATLGIVGQAVIIVSELTLVLVLLAGLAFVDLLLTAFTLIFFSLVAALLSKIMSSWASKLGARASEAEISSYVSVQEAVRTYRETTVTGRRSTYIDRFAALRARAAYTQAEIQVMTQVTKYVFEAAMIIGGGLLAAFQLAMSDITSGITIIVVYLAAASRIMPSLLRVQAGLLTMRTSAGMATGTFALSDELSDVDAGRAAKKKPPTTERQRLEFGLSSGFEDFEPRVVIAGATVTYPDAPRPAIRNLSLSVEPGDSLALVGTTGAGKSTLADLILGVLEPDVGAVAIGGLSPQEAVERWPGALAYVPQEVALVDGTVGENVALGLPEDLVDPDRVWEALERAQLAAYMREQPLGLESLVGENGVRLSGGQRQRLGIARALYTRPKLIVLDEATSALDAETEQAVSETLASLDGEVTLVIVAHRLATIRHSDAVAYLADGHLAAYGTFDEVRRQVPAFDNQAQLLGL